MTEKETDRFLKKIKFGKRGLRLTSSLFFWWDVLLEKIPSKNPRFEKFTDTFGGNLIIAICGGLECLLFGNIMCAFNLFPFIFIDIISATAFIIGIIERVFWVALISGIILFIPNISLSISIMVEYIMKAVLALKKARLNADDYASMQKRETYEKLTGSYDVARFRDDIYPNKRDEYWAGANSRLFDTIDIKELKKQFLELSKKYHPDNNPHQENFLYYKNHRFFYYEDIVTEYNNRLLYLTVIDDYLKTHPEK